jgi:2-(1,2-epoxy-1,2-dihydrophenyl)acetyl-CoA isomerase
MIRNPEDGSYLVDLNDGVLKLTFNRPEHGNAIPSTAVPDLTRLFQQSQADPAVRCILIQGKGKVFSAGGDVGSFANSIKQEVGLRQADFSRRMGNLAGMVEAVVAFDRPIVAAIRGAVAGAGLMYPLVSDYAIGDDSATFVFAHQRVGLAPDGGVSFLLPQVVGTRTARTLLLTAAKLDAQEAWRLGILSRIVPAEELESESMKLAQRFAQAPQRAVSLAKRLVNAANSTSLADQLQAEREGIVKCVGDPDFAEGVMAFVEKRRADFPSARPRPSQS